MAIEGWRVAALVGFIPNMTTFPTAFFDKIGFGMDYIGRAREIAFIKETIRSTYNTSRTKVNIAVWNMHIRESHHFDDNILVTGLKPMGNGSELRVVVFSRKEYFRNENENAEHNWRVSGNVGVKGNLAMFRAVDGGEGVWGYKVDIRGMDTATYGGS